MNNRESGHDQLFGRLIDLLTCNCPMPQVLGEYGLRLLPTQEMQRVQRHVEFCPHCQAELQEMRSFLADEGDSPGHTMLEVVLQWGRQALQRPVGLSFAGVRGGVSQAQTFAAGSLLMALSIQDQEDGCKKVLGLVTNEDGALLQHGAAWLRQERHVVSSSAIDERGNLVLAGVAPGQYDLGLQCGETRVWIHGVVV